MVNSGWALALHDACFMHNDPLQREWFPAVSGHRVAERL